MFSCGVRAKKVRNRHPSSGRSGTYETFGGVVHETELEPLLIEERLGQRPSQRVGRQGRLVAVLQLGKQFLQSDEKRFITIER